MPSSNGSTRRPARIARACGLAAAVVLASISLSHAQSAEDFSIERTNPDAVIHFRGLHLTDARTDTARDEIILTFAEQVDPALFDRLQTALPGWVGRAYARSNSAVVRAARPVTFMTAGVANGFALRIVPRGPRAANDLQLRGQIDGSGRGVALAGMQPAEPRGAFGLRGSSYASHHAEAMRVTMREKPLAMAQAIDAKLPEAKRGGDLALSAHWRHPRHGTIVESELAGGIPVGGGLKLIGSVADTYAKAKAVRRANGTWRKLDENAISAAAGIAYNFRGLLSGLGQASGEALWGKSGWGGRLAYAERDHAGDWSASLAYRAPYDETLKAVAEHGNRSRAQLAVAHRIADGFWGQAVLRATRYGVDGDDNVAQTAGADLSLRYVTDLGGFWAGLTYEFNGEYVIDSHKYTGASPTPFTPLGIRNRETHALSASLSTELFRRLWVDGYGGYAIDRYGPDGYFAGGNLRYAFAPGWALAVGGGYSQIATRQGERGPEATAGLKLIFDWGDGTPNPARRPVSRAYFGSL